MAAGVAQIPWYATLFRGDQLEEALRKIAPVAMQEGLGLHAVTDGEFRRRSWWLELLLNWEGISAHRTGTVAFTWHTPEGKEQPFSRLWINAPIRWKPSPVVRAYQFLKAHTKAVPKVTMAEIVYSFGASLVSTVTVSPTSKP